MKNRACTSCWGVSCWPDPGGDTYSECEACNGTGRVFEQTLVTALQTIEEMQKEIASLRREVEYLKADSKAYGL